MGLALDSRSRDDSVSPPALRFPCPSFTATLMICLNRKTRVFDPKGCENTIARQSDIVTTQPLFPAPHVI